MTAPQWPARFVLAPVVDGVAAWPEGIDLVLAPVPERTKRLRRESDDKYRRCQTHNRARYYCGCWQPARGVRR